MEPKKITVIILTKNEGLHIGRAIRSVGKLQARTVVVDCGSTDSTLAIAKDLGADVYVNPWINYASQFNWALQNVSISTEWVMRLDADEYLDDELIGSLQTFILTDNGMRDGAILRRYVVFKNKVINWGGGVSPGHVLRIWRHNMGRCENRWMDEHILLESSKPTPILRGRLLDHNFRNITWWIEKHNSYASREAADLAIRRYSIYQGNFKRETVTAERQLNANAKLKRIVKNHVFMHMPLSIRATLYFCYRLVLRGGILDGPKGWLFHFLQALWYRCLVDMKLAEVVDLVERQGLLPASAVRQALSIGLETVEDKSHLS